MENLTGKQLGPYRVVAPLGEGGMAAVYKAYQPGMDRYVALKVLPQQLAADPLFVERFKREAKTLAQLQHPHILPVFDYGESEGYTYIAMPLVESGTLTNLLKGQPLPFDQVRSIITQVGDALDYAHTLGLVHRDVKPSNVLIDKRGNCLLTDFGIAKIVESTAKLTNTGGILGTPAYMSPEQGRGDKVDARSDIYALGVVLYEMATGRVPFDAETPIAIIFKHVQDPLPPPSLINRNVPDALERVILKSMAKNPDDRFAAAGDMVRAIKAAISDTGGEATHKTTWEPSTQPGPRSTAAPSPAATGPQPTFAAPPTIPPAPTQSGKKKQTPVWLFALLGLFILGVCVAIGVGGAIMSGLIPLGGVTPSAIAGRATDTPTPAAQKPTDTPTLPPADRPTDTPTPTPAVQSSVQIVEVAHSSADALNTIDSYTVVVNFSLGVERGILEVWIARFADPDCLKPDPVNGTDTTVYYNNHIVDNLTHDIKIELAGPPTDAKYLAVSARLTDETISTVLAQDADNLPCLANTASASTAAVNPFTKTPPLTDGLIQPGEWDHGVLAVELPNGKLYFLNDDKYLYLLLDVTGDIRKNPPLSQAPWGDYFALAFDVNENAQIDKGIDLYYGMSGTTIGYQYFLGPSTYTGLNPTRSVVWPGFDSTPEEAAPHRFWEFALLLQEIDAKPGEQMRFGITVYSQTPSFQDDMPPGYQNDFTNLIAITLGK